MVPFYNYETMICFFRTIFDVDIVKTARSAKNFRNCYPSSAAKTFGSYLHTYYQQIVIASQIAAVTAFLTNLAVEKRVASSNKCKNNSQYRCMISMYTRALNRTSPRPIVARDRRNVFRIR